MSWTEDYADGVLYLMDQNLAHAKYKFKRAHDLALKKKRYKSALAAIKHHAEVLLAEGRVTDAKQALIDSARQIGKVFGNCSPEYYSALRGAALNCLELMDYSAALKLFHQLWEILNKTNSGVSDAAVSLVLLQTYALALNGEHAEALTAWEAKVELLIEVLGEDSPQLALLLEILANCQDRLTGESPQSNPVLERLTYFRSQGKLLEQTYFDPAVIDFNRALRNEGIQGFATRVIEF